MKPAILFDLGGTLVQYYDRAEFSQVLAEAIGEVETTLRRRGLLHVAAADIQVRAAQENHEAADHCVRPLEGRLARIFQLDAAGPGADPAAKVGLAFQPGDLVGGATPVPHAVRCTCRWCVAPPMISTWWGSGGS